MVQPRTANLPDSAISAREAQVLALVGEHLTNAEIAQRLFISVRTVESHVSALLRKLQAADRRELATMAATSSVDDQGRVETVPRPRPAALLPVPLTSFVGRAAERAALADALSRHRLVTALGSGGVGKTRLALAVAADLTDRYADGAWYVDLVPVTEPGMVGAAVAGALGFGEQQGQSPTETVVARLAQAQALLVLDNCEHLVDGVVAFVEQLLPACPRISVLATSRARLMLPFEAVFPVPGLSLDGPDDDGVADAVALFLDRGAMAGWVPPSEDDVPRIAAICRELDGIALAIELAAARVATVGLDGLEAGLTHPLGLLAGAARVDERHRSVRATLDWSYQLLAPVEQAVLRRAAAFAAPFSLTAAAEVVRGPPLDAESEVAAALAGLADQSLLVVMSDPAGTRYRMLETIRQYGAEQLDALGEGRDVWCRHLAWCRATAAALGDDPDIAAFEAVADDLRAALAWASDQPDQRAEAHTLAVRLGRLAFACGLASEAQRRFTDAAGLAEAVGEATRATEDGARADGDGVGAHHAPDDLDLAAAVALCRLSGDDALRLYLAAADAARRVGDRRAVAVRITRAVELMDRTPGLLSEPPPPAQVEALRSEALELAGDDPYIQAAVGILLFGVPESELDLPTVERAVEMAGHVGDPRLCSAAIDQLTVAQLAHGDVAGAAASSRRRLDLLEPLTRGPDLAFEWSDALHMSALTSLGVGELAAARRYAQARRDLSIHREDDHLVVNWLLVLAALVGDWDQAVELGEQFRIGWERAGRRPLRGFASAPAAAAMVAGLRGDAEARSWWLDVFAQMRPPDAGPGVTGFRETFDAVLHLHRGDADQAAATLSRPLDELVAWNAAVWRQWYAALVAEASVIAAHPERTGRLATARHVAAGNPVAAAIVDRADALAADAPARLPEVAVALERAGCRYQQARTLVLAGGEHQAVGARMLREMGAVPMAR